MIFDSHAHYDDEQFDGDRDEVIKKCVSEGVGYILNASSDASSIEKTVALAQQYQCIYAAVGLHPHNANEFDDSILNKISTLCRSSKVVAIGEIGLDYYYDFSPRNVQKQVFIRQLDLAMKLNLPVIIHMRDAAEDTLQILENYKNDIKGVMHCFSGSSEVARILLNWGLHISIGGIITFKNAKKVCEALKAIPDERLLIETDCPYLSPEPFRGRRNDSSLLKYTIQKIAEIKGKEPEYIENITTENAKGLFAIE